MTEQAQIVDQPPPVHREGVTSVQALVRADLEEREAVGVARYGTALQAHNGRHALIDAYQEVLDLACYLRQELLERQSAGLGRFDGDVLASAVADAAGAVCGVLTIEACRAIGERAVADLADVEGVTVLRGPEGAPWTSEHAEAAAQR